MKLTIILLLTLQAALATASKMGRSRKVTGEVTAAPLEIHLTIVENTKAEAFVMNRGKADLKLLKTGTILDHYGNQQAEIVSERGDGHVNFLGNRLAVDTTKLGKDDFWTIKKGDNAKIDWNLAMVHDLSGGGKFNVSMFGTIPFAHGKDNALVGSVYYESNTVQARVDGFEAEKKRAKWYKDTYKKREGCTGEKFWRVRDTLVQCEEMASRAADEAMFGPNDKMLHFFKSADNATRMEVGGVFRKVAAECKRTISQQDNYYCSDVAQLCKKGDQQRPAYALAHQGKIVFCGRFFDYALAPTTQACTERNNVVGQRAGLLIGLLTHMPLIKGTRDYVRTYKGIQMIGRDENVDNADTYRYFATAVVANCTDMN